MGKPQLPARSRCALCLQEEKLCKSHIIPNFIFKPTFASEGFATVKSAERDQTDYKAQTGYWEWLLCAKCEGKLSGWESYAAKVLVGGVGLQVTHLSNGLLEVRGIDYKLFKLFQLSILWRSSVSRLPFFRQVSLGPREEVLRSMLLNEDPGTKSEFGCWMVGLKLEDRSTSDVLIEPTSARIGSRRKVNFIFGSFHWSFTVSQLQDETNGLQYGTLTEEGTLTLWIRQITDIPAVTAMMARIFKKEHLEKFSAR